MNRSFAIVHRLVCLAAPLILAGPFVAQTATPPANPSTTPPAATANATPIQPVIRLPRLNGPGKPELPRLAKTKVTVEDLAPQSAAGAKSVMKQNLNYLTLDAGKEWSRPLRGAAKDITFVSFLAYGSEGTVFDIGGAKITVKPSSKPGYLQLAVGMPANSTAPAPAFGDLVKIEKHDGASLVALPVFTVRLDPVAKVWDLYLFQRLVAEDIPFPDTTGARKFSVQAGREGAWVCGLVLSDENPLYVDANANGIDDAFETQKRGALLAANAPAADRRQLALEWKDAQRVADLKPWKIRRPVPNDVVAMTPPPR